MKKMHSVEKKVSFKKFAMFQKSFFSLCLELDEESCEVVCITEIGITNKYVKVENHQYNLV